MTGPSSTLCSSKKLRRQLSRVQLSQYLKKTQLRSRRRTFNFESAILAVCNTQSEINIKNTPSYTDAYMHELSNRYKKYIEKRNKKLENLLNVGEELVYGAEGLNQAITTSTGEYMGTYQHPNKSYSGNPRHNIHHYDNLNNFFKEYSSNTRLYEQDYDNSLYAQQTHARAKILGDDEEVGVAINNIESSLKLKAPPKDNKHEQTLDVYAYSEGILASASEAKNQANDTSNIAIIEAELEKKISLNAQDKYSHKLEHQEHELKIVKDKLKYTEPNTLTFNNKLPQESIKLVPEAGLGDIGESKDVITLPQSKAKSANNFLYNLVNDQQNDLPCLNPKAVIFDLDGTLLDTAPDIIGACNATLRHFGFDPISEELAMTKITAGMRELLKLGIPKEEQSKLDINGVMREYFAQYYLNHICERTVPFRGMFELLNDLFDAKIKVGVVTSKYSKMAHKLMANFYFYKKLNLILGCDDTIHAKPHPEPIIKAINALNIAPFEALYVGDHLNDILSANAARVHSAAALWGYGENECGDARSWHAQFILNDVNDLHQLTLNWVD